MQLNLKAVKEQARSHVVPKSAKPIFFPKLLKIASFIHRQSRSDISVHERYIPLRDQAMFKVQIFASYRASNVALILTHKMT